MSGSRARGRSAARLQDGARAGEADGAEASDRGGPRSPAGKARVARNPLRHGLSQPVLADPATAAAVEALTRRMSPAADAELARAVAQAQVDLIRIRRARQDLVATTFMHLAAAHDAAAARNPGAAPLQLHLANLAVRLAAMDRYERRAFSRRKFAIRALCSQRTPPRSEPGGKG